MGLSEHGRAVGFAEGVWQLSRNYHAYALKADPLIEETDSDRIFALRMGFTYQPSRRTRRSFRAGTIIFWSFAAGTRKSLWPLLRANAV